MSDNNIHTLGGGRSLGGDGAAEPLPEAWANRSTQPRVGRVGGPSTAAPSRGSGRMATLRDLAGPAPSGHAGHGHGGSRHSEEDDDDTPQNFFAGGERSGLSVENPNHPDRRGGGSGAHNQVRDILKKAAEGSRAASERETARPARSWGAGNTLGSDEVESEAVVDPNADSDANAAVRNITFWRTGYTIEDGPLRLYSDPESAKLLESIQQGIAPPDVLNVAVGQPVELRVSRRLDEDYVAPPPGPFAGAGNRLGNPVPATVQTSTSAASTSSAPPQAASSASGGEGAGSFEVDMSAPTTSIQIRLADGTRLVSRMNLTHTVGDIRRFINAARPGSSSRPFTVQTTLPVRILDDETQTIDAAGLKNSVVVQRWL